jgi:hypothetical protein
LVLSTLCGKVGMIPRDFETRLCLSVNGCMRHLIVMRDHQSDTAEGNRDSYKVGPKTIWEGEEIRGTVWCSSAKRRSSTSGAQCPFEECHRSWWLLGNINRSRNHCCCARDSQRWQYPGASPVHDSESLIIIGLIES